MMNTSVENWAVVVVGGWNNRIFTPQWIAEHIGLPQEHMEFILTLDGGNLQPTIKLADSNISFVHDRILVRPLQASSEGMKKAEDLVLKFLRKLEHTPLTGVGINFRFIEDSPSSDDNGLFQTNDFKKVSDAGLTIISSSIKRQIKKGDQIINISLERNENAQVSYDFNFHSETKTCAAAIAALDGKCAVHLKTTTDLLGSVYGKQSVGNDGN